MFWGKNQQGIFKWNFMHYILVDFLTLATIIYAKLRMFTATSLDCSRFYWLFSLVHGHSPRWLYLMWLHTSVGPQKWLINSYSASHDNWCTGTLWNWVITAQCEGMGEVGSAWYEPALLPPCPSIRPLCYSNCQRSTQSHQLSKG